MGAPRFYRWGGPDKYSWSFGWLTGKDNDLVCATTHIPETMYPYHYLSPACPTRPVALLAFLLKAIVLRLDLTMRP
jgi:hypothetical protein